MSGSAASSSGSSSGRCRRDVFEEAVAPLPRSYPAVNLRDNGDRPIASSSKATVSSSRVAAGDRCSYSSLDEFRAQDAGRKQRLEKLFKKLQDRAWRHDHAGEAGAAEKGGRQTTAEERDRRAGRQEYLNELYKTCCEGEDHQSGRGPTFAKFRHFIEEKEASLWTIFTRIDSNNDMLLDPVELQTALAQADIKISTDKLQDMIREMDQSGSGRITFAEWRDYLLLLPRKTSIRTVYNYWATFSRPRLASSIATQDLDIVLAEKPAPPASASSYPARIASSVKGKGRAVDQDQATLPESATHDEDDAVGFSVDSDGESEQDKGIFDGSGAYLLAGGLAGAVSRTATAPFDRLKVYLINHVEKSGARIPGLKTAASHPVVAASNIAKTGTKGLGAFAGAVKDLYGQGGLHAFFIGNGLNVIKIFPESAVKFWSYEYSKRWFARNVDHSNVKDISGSSRFIAGGLGGVSSQLLIYPLETWKTRVMSSTSADPGALRGNALYAATAKDMWSRGGLRAYYKGLNVGLIGVFPYSAIDMSLFAAFKKAYVQYTGDEEPGALGSLSFGAVSGGLGATSVYPLNLLRTRMQTQGTPAHPRRYAGWKDVGVTCYRNEGIMGFYKGLSPTLLKVSPSMGISWLVYEYSTALLFEGPSASQPAADTEESS